MEAYLFAIIKMFRYSFAIIMSELFSREVPFRDTLFAGPHFLRDHVFHGGRPELTTENTEGWPAAIINLTTKCWQ